MPNYQTLFESSTHPIEQFTTQTSNKYNQAVDFIFNIISAIDLDFLFFLLTSTAHLFQFIIESIINTIII
jgi:hypothetical protein